MAHGYRTFQHWDQWLTHEFLGSCLLEAEEKTFSLLLKKYYGKQTLLIGVPHQHALLSSTRIPCHSLVTPIIAGKDQVSGLIEGDFHELPILTGSVDLVMLPHTLEFMDNPRQLLSEACRVIKPEGIIAIAGFNPVSMWGIKKLLDRSKNIPWRANFIRANKIKNWLHLADFELEKSTSVLFTPPVNSQSTYKKLHFLEKIGSKCFPFFGGVYILLARAKVIPLTPIRLKWKQQLSNIGISTTISGHIAR